jgi:hypothetical protein
MTAWSCDACGEVHASNTKKCASCGHTVFTKTELSGGPSRPAPKPMDPSDIGRQAGPAPEPEWQTEPGEQDGSEPAEDADGLSVPWRVGPPIIAAALWLPDGTAVGAAVFLGLVWLLIGPRLDGLAQEALYWAGVGAVLTVPSSFGPGAGFGAGLVAGGFIGGIMSAVKLWWWSP